MLPGGAIKHLGDKLNWFLLLILYLEVSYDVGKQDVHPQLSNTTPYN